MKLTGGEGGAQLAAPSCALLTERRLQLISPDRDRSLAMDFDDHAAAAIDKLLQATFGLWNALLTVNGIMRTVFSAYVAILVQFAHSRNCSTMAVSLSSVPRSRPGMYPPLSPLP